MFVLTKIDDDKEKFILMPNKAVYTIGRLSTDLILSDDLSISRTHVRVNLPSTGSNDSLTVVDLGSKYGTFVNDGIQLNKKILAKSPIPLQVGDKIRLGALKNVWQLSQLHLTTTPSSLARPELEELQQLLQPLGGALLPNWTTECYYLTMNNVSVTVKLLHALLDNKPIVNVAFWRAFSKSAQRVHISEDWPKPKDFQPATSPGMPSIEWNPNRTKLFASKTFVFCNRKHFETYGLVVQKAGGACKDLNSGVRRQFLTKTDVVVIQYVPSTQSQATETIHNVHDILEQVGRRLIPEYEIGLAILHCSTDKFCNPTHKMIDNSLLTTESMNSSILVLNTERTQTEANSNKGTELIISESEIYAPSVENEKLETEAQPQETAAAPKQVEKSKSMLTMRKRKNVIFLDSSDEDGQAAEPTSSKKTKMMETKPKQKRKLPIAVDSSSDEDEQDSVQLRKISKTLPGDKSKQNSVDKPAEKKELSVAVSNPSKRSTRANPAQQLEVEKQPEMPSRRSPRNKQVPEGNITNVPQIDEDSEKKQEIKSKAPAKSKLTVPLIDEDSEEDEELFQFQKKAPASVERAPFEPTESNSQSTHKSADKSMASSKINQPARISVRNFLEKSQNPIVASQEASAAPAASQPRKRLRLQQVNESDSDDNENLFKFAGNKKAKKSFGSDNEADDGGMFAFNSGVRKEQNNEERDEDQDSVSTEPFIPYSKPKSKYVVVKPKEQPVKVNISGWLSCSGLHDDIKPKTDPDMLQMEAEPDHMKIKEEDEDCEVKDAQLKWIASMKDCIQVRMCNLNITVRSHDETNAVDATDSKYSGRKNFKKFVKKQNLHPQHRTVELKHMQLGEGMVINL